MRESDLEAFFRKRIRLAGGQTIKLVPVERGIPDRLVFLPGGRIYLVELKSSTGSLSPAQLLWREKLSALGVTVHVLNSQLRVVAWLREVFAEDDDTHSRRNRG